MGHEKNCQSLFSLSSSRERSERLRCALSRFSQRSAVLRSKMLKQVHDGKSRVSSVGSGVSQTEPAQQFRFSIHLRKLSGQHFRMSLTLSSRTCFGIRFDPVEGRLFPASSGLLFLSAQRVLVPKLPAALKTKMLKRVQHD